MLQDSPIRLSVEDGIARIVLASPDNGNAMTDAWIDALDRITLEIIDRSDVRAVLISSTGKRFSVGGNIKSYSQDRAALPAVVRRLNASLHGSISRLQHMPAPTVVAVQGVVAGGALSIISGCDVIVAAEQARFVAAYASIGYCPDLGGTISLARRIGLSRARRFHLMHEQIDAATAERIGLADFVVPADKLEATAESIADRFAKGPTRSYAEIRKLFQTAGIVGLETQLELETQSLVELTKSDDAWEALNAFLAKRKPNYQGR